MKMKLPIQVVTADDHSLFRAGVRAALQSCKDIRLVAEAGNGLQLLKLLSQLEVDLVLLDLNMPVMDGPKVLTEIKRHHPSVKVILLSSESDPSTVYHMMELGANSYLSKDCGADTLAEAIRSVHERDYYFSDLTHQGFLSGLKQKTAPASVHPVTPLSQREINILKLICEEKSTKEIADQIDLSPRTIEAIRDRLKAKTGTRSVAGLVLYAVKAGLVS